MQLKELGVKGITGKNKAELYQMLLDARPPLIQPKKRERKPAPAPVPEPVMKAKPASEEKKVKVDSLAKYLKPYKGEYQDYTDSEEREVIYPTVIIKKLIKMAYEGEPFEKIHTTIGYSPEETKTMLYDHYEGRIDIDHPKTYEPRKTKSEIYAELVREAEKKKSIFTMHSAVHSWIKFNELMNILGKVSSEQQVIRKANIVKNKSHKPQLKSCKYGKKNKTEQK